MRVATALVLSLLLAVDASAQPGEAPPSADPIGQILQQPPPSEAAPAVQQPPPPEKKRRRGLFGRRRATEAAPTRVERRGPPPPTAASFIGSDEAAVRARLGEPTLARAEGAGAMWTYVTEACALHMFFRLDRDGRMKVNAAGAGPRRRADATPDVDACVAGALAQ